MHAADRLLPDLAEHQKFQDLCELVDNQADVNAVQADGMSALHWVVYHDNTEVAQRLIKAGANASATTRYGITPLVLACQNGNGDIVDLLLSAGANPNTAIAGGETAIMTAARTGKLRPVELLIARGADVNAEESNHQTALMWAAAEGNADVVQALLTAGARRDHQLDSGFTALFFAIREGHWNATKRLLDSGCDINTVIKTQQSPRFGKGSLRLTPLLLAVENGHLELAKKLLDAGADPNAAPSGYSALHSLTWVRKPIRGDGDPSPKGSGVYSALDLTRMLVKAGANINARYERGKSELSRFTYDGSTPFMLASQTSDVPLMQLLLELGADYEMANVDGTTPLLAAAGVGWLGNGDEAAGTEAEALAAVELLIRLGADPNVVDYNGETVIHGAAYHNRAEVVRKLIAAGANIDVWNHENRAGRTPLMIALGYMPGNFSPSVETSAVIEQAMVAAKTPLPDKTKIEEHRQQWDSTSNDDVTWKMRDLEYARVDGSPLLLDLYLPPRPLNAPLIVWVHGGAWRSGSKENVPILNLVKSGYAIASVNYRLSTNAKFPSQVHDVKAAVRYLRYLAHRYHYRNDRIVIAGDSAGGHLAALVGTTNGSRELEGTVGNHLNQSSNVQAIVDYYGPTNLMTILEQSTPHGLEVRRPALQLLLGGQPTEQPNLAKLASPVAHVDAQDPPLMVIHGDKDPQVPIAQSSELQAAYSEFQLPVKIEVVSQGVHGGEAFYNENMLHKIEEFLRSHLP